MRKNLFDFVQFVVICSILKFFLKCDHGCGTSCQKPKGKDKEKKGECPVRPDIGTCVDKCKDDASCKEFQKCVS